MADVTLAECEGNVWLVGGEQHVDDLLFGSLPPGVTIEFVACATRAELYETWQRLSGNTDGAQAPWVIHPGIVRRIRSGGVDTLMIRFGSWSALMDGEAQDAVRTAANKLAGAPAARLLLQQYVGPGAPPGLAELQKLRGQLAAAALAQAGVDAAHLDHGTTLAGNDPADADRLDLIIREAGAAAPS